MNKIFSSIYTYLLVGVLFLGCTYWIYKNVKIEDVIGSPDVENISYQNKIVSKSGIKIEVRNNDIVEVVSPDAVRLIVEGDEIENFESYSDISISPDETSLCFIVHTITPSWLYTVNLDGHNLHKKALAKNCVWSPDSKYVAFNNQTTDVSPIDVYIINPDIGDLKNLTFSKDNLNIVKQYSDIKWLNNTTIESSFIEFPFSNIQDTKTGKVLIDITSGTITNN